MAASSELNQILEEMSRKMTKAVEATKREFQNIRTGRASVALVEGIQVDYYNTSTPLKGLGSISTPDPKTIAIQPWDPSAIPDIEKAILKSGLGLTPLNDGRVLRIQVPSLTQERREELSKLVKRLAEEGRVSVRNARHEGIEHVKKLEKTKAIPEDISHSAQKDAQKVTDKFISQIEEALKQKESEIHAV
jgi:ribosome recycling factor